MVSKYPFMTQIIATKFLNQPIMAKEIETCIKTLKSSKSAGLDNILNEYIKCTYKILLPVYVQLFNIVLDTSIIPSAWVVGIIIPIYKHKGNPDDPANYRPITLLSCFNKLFIALLNTRLNNYLEDSEILNENQAGFHKSYSTLDHIFTLSCLTKLFNYYKKNFLCFHRFLQGLRLCLEDRPITKKYLAQTSRARFLKPRSHCPGLRCRFTPV